MRRGEVECEGSDGGNWWEVAPMSLLLFLGCFQKQDFCERSALRGGHGKLGPVFEYLEEADKLQKLGSS